MADEQQVPNYQQPVQSYQPGQLPPTQPEVQNNVEEDEDVFSWTASEFIAHSKSAGWYGVLAGGAIGFAIVMYILTRDRVTSAMIVIVAALFGIMAARKPRELTYALEEDGVRVGQKLYPYSGFKSFSVIQEGGIESIWFMPMQRFMPGLSIYFAPEDGDDIIDILGDFLPFEPRDTDPIDKLMHRLRF